MHPWLIDVN